MKRKKGLSLLDKRRTIWERMFFVLMFTVLAFWTLTIVMMFVWAIVSSLKTNLEYVNYPLRLPEKLMFSNFQLALKKLEVNGVGFVGMIWNSLWRAIGGNVIGITCQLIVAYVFGQYDFKGKKFLFDVVIFTMILPLYGSFSADYKINMDLGLNNSYRYLIRSIGGIGAGMLIPYGFYKSMPKAYRESIYIDGGNDFQAFFKVYFPLSRNIFIAFFLTGFIGSWNDFGTALLYFDKMPDLALGLYYFQQEIIYVANTPAFFAGALVVMLPVLLLFIFAADKIMGQLFVGSLKG